MIPPTSQLVNRNTSAALEKLSDEIAHGRMAGPFPDRPSQNLRISPLGLVPKSEPGHFRLIHNLSYPDSGSVNDGIDKQLCIVQYTSFDHAVNLVVGAGKGALLAKADVKSAFRLLPVHPDDFCLLGIKLLDRFMSTKPYPWGLPVFLLCLRHFLPFLNGWLGESQVRIASVIMLTISCS